MRTRVIGLGNPILSDDGVGLQVARALAARLGASDVDVVESEVAGFALLELLDTWERVILVDAVMLPGMRPGTVVRLGPEDLATSLRLRSVHEIDLPTALALGTRLGFAMPKEIVIIAIQAEDTLTFGETLTPRVAAALPRAVERILEELRHGGSRGVGESPAGGVLQDARV
ncbi:MAG: hydrogenase maturation protease [Acidobacteriota bacterium]